MRIRKRHDVIIYTGGTKFCELAKDYFRQSGTEFQEIEVRGNIAMLEEMKEKSDNQKAEPPVVIIDDRAIVGYQPALYETIMRTAFDEEDEAQRKEDEKAISLEDNVPEA